MPELCRFRGIVIRMHWDEHPPPHFHVEHGESEAFVEIETLSVARGRLPRRVRRLVLEWASLHQDELRDAWNRVMQGERAGRIDPLP